MFSSLQKTIQGSSTVNHLQIKFTLLFLSMVFGLFSVQSVYAQAASTLVKEAQEVDSTTPLTELELGQALKYNLQWNCSIVSTPPNNCGTFTLTDPLPAGFIFETCLVSNNIYSCTHDVGMNTVTIVLGDGTTDVLGDGDAANATIIGRVSTDPMFAGTTLDNTATAELGEIATDPTSSSSLPINLPTNTWSLAKTVSVPGGALGPALDNDLIYKIEVCPNGPAGVGTGTIVLNNPVITDVCPVGMNLVGATFTNDTMMGSTPLTFTGACPNIAFDLAAAGVTEFAPADGCHTISLAAQLPSGTFNVGDMVTNDATLDADEIGNPGDDPCPKNCTSSVTSTIQDPVVDANVTKDAKRTTVGLDARNEYYFTFDTLDTNVSQSGIVLQDVFPTEISPLSLSIPGWTNNSVVADITDSSGNPLVPPVTGYNGSLPVFINVSTAPGFRISFTTPVPPGFETEEFILSFRADGLQGGSPLAVGDDFDNCMTVGNANISEQACANVELVDDTTDIISSKNMPSGVQPGTPFPVTFIYNQDNTSAVGAQNPTITDCLAKELDFLSWDGISYTGLDDPVGAVNTANTVPRGVEPVLQVLVTGDAGFSCAADETMLIWSWSSAGGLFGAVDSSGAAAAAANPFTFPVRADTDADDVGDASGPLGTFVGVTLSTTMQVKPGVLVQSGLTNDMVSTLDNVPDLRCISGTLGGGSCTVSDTYDILSAAALAGRKYIGGFPGLPNFDPVNPPAGNTAADIQAVGTTPEALACPPGLVVGDGLTRAPCVAQAMKDQPFNYRIRLNNEGNVPLTNYVVYDVLPNIDTAGSDTGISEALSGFSRASTWAPLMVGPITLSSNNPTVDAEIANAIVEYSASSNACRPELSIANDIGGSGWQTSCVDDWTPTPLVDSVTFPNGFGSVKAWRVKMPFETTEWPVGNNPFGPVDVALFVDFPMLADPDAPPSDYTVPTVEIAWNNIAHRATNADDDSRLLATEIIKTGITMPPEFPLEATGLRIGNLVWVDEDNDGVAEVGEQGIFDVTVQLWVDNGVPGPSADDVLYDATQTDAFGNYLFDDPVSADPGSTDPFGLERNNLGIPAGDYYVVIPEDQTGSFVLDDNYSSTTNELNANDDVDNNDNGAFDSATDGIGVLPTTDPASPDIDGVYSSPVNLTLNAEPDNEQVRSDDPTDDDNDFFDAADGGNDSNVSVDFGFYQLRLGNHVWLDANNNGVADSDEQALENVITQLFLDDGDGVFDPLVDTLLESDTTDAQGQYLFDGLDEGNYFVAIPTGQTGLTTDSAGTFSSDTLVSSTATSALGAAIANENADDGGVPAVGSPLFATYESVSTLLMLAPGGALTGESDTSQDGVNGSDTTVTADPAFSPTAELNENIVANQAFPDTNSFLSVDFGLVQAVSFGSTIWIDQNGNSTQDAGEFPIPNATVTLLDNAAVPMPIDGDPVTPGVQLIQVTTDADGQYNFNDLPPGTYRVSVDLSTSAGAVPNIDDYLPSPVQVVNANNNARLDSNIDLSLDTNLADQTHISAPITLTSGGEPNNERDPISAGGTGVATDLDQPNQTGLVNRSGNMTLDMGFVAPVSLGSTLWVDDNEDGLQTLGETPIVNATVTLLNADGTEFDDNLYMAGIQSLVILSDADGQYNFDGLPPGDYRVKVDLSTVDLLANPNAAVLVPTPSQVTAPELTVATSINNDDSNIDAGVPGTAVGTNAGDTATDRIFTSGVITLSPMDEPLLEEDGISAAGVATTPDSPNQGLTPADDPDSNGNMTLDFGFIEPVSLGSTVWFDSNGDGLQSAGEPPIVAALVTLLNDDGTVYDSNPATVAIDSLTVSTDAQGQYNFNGLPEGDYRVQVNLSPATSHVGAMLSPTPPQTPDPDAAGPGQDNNTDSNVDVTAPGHSPATNVYQSGIVSLTIGGEPLVAVETDLIGTPGPDQPNQTATELDANGNMTVDMGFFAPVSLGSTIWNDVDGDGTQDSGEPAILNATVTLLDALGNPIDGNPNMAGVQLVTDTTDADGQYNFDGLLPGTYRVQVNLGSVVGGEDFLPSPVQTASPEDNDNTDSNIDTAFDVTPTDLIHTSGQIILSVGGEPTLEADPINAAGNGMATDTDQPNQGLTPAMDPDSSGNMTVDMGFYMPVSLGSTLWVDDGDGIQEAGEAPIAGATVTLLDSTGTPVTFDTDPVMAGVQNSVVTDANGQYNFNNLPEGTYSVSVDLTAASNPNATALIPTLINVPDANANPLAAATNLDSNVDTDNVGNNALTDVWFSEQVTLSFDDEAIGETDPIGTPGVDQPNQGLALRDDPDASGNMTLDMGFIEPVSIGSTVWLDADLDGSQDDDELGIAGATVTLLDSGGMPVTFDADPSTPGVQNSVTTDATGQYNFDGLPAGSYFVEVSFPSGGLSSYLPTPTQVAGANTDNSNTDSNIATTGNNGTASDTSDDLYRSELIVLSIGGEPMSEMDAIDANLAGGLAADQPNQIAAEDPDANGNMTVDFGFYAAVSLGSTVWLDTDADGMQDDAEEGIAGATVTLLNADGTAVTGVTPVMTDATGQYNFNGLLPGDYRVKVTLPADKAYAPTPTQVADPDAVADVNNDSNIDLAVPGTAVGTAAGDTTSDDTYTSGVVSLMPGLEPINEMDSIDALPAGGSVADQPNQDTSVGGANPDNSGNMMVDFGFIEAVSLGSTLWVDDGDGIQESGELPIEGATVTLLSSAGTPVTFDTDLTMPGIQNSVVTDAQGQYNFNGLPAGTYSVSVDLTAATNTNATALIPTLVNVPDANANPLLAATNLDSNVDVDNAGNNAATDVWFSEQVTLSVGGEAISETDPIGTPGTDQPNQTLLLTEDPDSSGNMTLDMGFIEPVSIGSTVWLDADLDGTQDDDELGIAGATVTLLDSMGTPVTFDADPSTPGVQNSVTTDATGQYNFDGLPIGSYFVEVTFPSGTLSSYLPTPTQVAGANTNDSNSDSNIATTNNNGTVADTSDDRHRSELIVLTSNGEPTNEMDAIDANTTGGVVTDQPNQDTAVGGADPDANGNMTVDFGFYAPVSLGSTVWEDLDGDGTQDALEPGILGATVTLLDSMGVPVTFDVDPSTPGVQNSVMTDATGQYNFDALLPGSYRVQVDLSTIAGGSGDLFPTPVQVADPDAAVGVDDNTDSNIDFLADATTTDDVHISGLIDLSPGTEPVGETDLIGGGIDQPNQDTAVGGTDPDSSGNMTLDLGFVRPVSLGSTVWQDENGNGTQDDGEPTIQGATVTLLDSLGAEIDGDPYTAGVQAVTTMTDSEGQYFFNDLAPGDYRVQVDLASVTGGGALIPTPTQIADPDAAGDDNTDSNIDVAFDPIAVDQIHTSGIVTLLAGGEPAGEVDPIDLIDGNGDVVDAPGQTAVNPDNSGNMTVDFGFYAPVSIGSFVWEDTNGDGLQDANEPPLASAMVTLLAETAPGSGVFGPAFPIGSAVAVPTFTVGPDGLYEFTNLPPGTYQVQVEPPAGFFPSPIQNDTPNDDTANDSNIADEPGGAGIFVSAAFDVTSGGEPSEAGPDTNRGDNQDGAASSAEDLSGNMTIDFGFVPPASLGNYVWLDLDMDGVQDANEDGIANVTVNLYQDSDGNGIIDGAELTTPVASAVTGLNGEYLFPDLEPGVVYQTGVDVATLPVGLVQTYDEGDGVGATDSLSDPIVLDPNEFHETADFGYAPPAGLGAVGDTIWVDADDDGVQDPGEPGIAGVTVSITPPPDVNLGAGLGVPITTMTDVNGKYLFPNLPLDESYIVEVDIVTLPAGYVSGPSNLGDPDVRDGNSTDADNQTIVVLTPANPINLDLDFGYLPPDDQNNSIGDTLWIDVDEDGNGPATAGDGSDLTEPVLPGVTVTLIQDNGDGVYNLADDTVFATTITDSNGMYLFTGIPDGDYIVLVTDQNNVLAGLDQTVDSDDPANPGAFVATTPNASFVDDLGVGIATPVEDLDQDFGYVDSNTTGGDGSIGDTIFFDENNSGLPDDGEGLEGVTVSLFGPGPDGDISTAGDNVLLATQVTDANGNYLFTGLDVSDTGANPGTDYEVVVDTTTLPNGGSGWSNTVDPDTPGTGDSSSITTISVATPDDLDQDFGYLGEDGNSLSGTVWPDTDGDGEQAEAGRFGGVTIEIRDQDGDVIRTVITDSNGDYEVTNLPDGIYTVVVTDEDNVLNGFEHTDSPNGASDTSDQTSKDDTGYVVDLDSAGVIPTPVSDETGDFGYQPVITNPISLGSFLASAIADDKVLIEWSTQTEVANLGFNVYAQVNGDWVLLNESLILGQGDAVSIQSYSATYASSATVFALSDIDLTGRETIHGPYALGEEHGSIADRKAIDWDAEKAERETKKANRLKQRQQQQLKRGLQLKQLLKDKKLHKKGNDLSQSESHKEGGMSRFFEGVAVSLLSALVPSAHAQTLEVTELINLQTIEHGIHEVSYADLVAAGLDLAGQSNAEFVLTSQGQEVAIQVTGPLDVFGADSAIRFIASQVNTLYTDKNMYTLSLVSGATPSDRIGVDSRPIPIGAATATSYLATKAYEPQLKYSFTSPNLEDPFYAKRMVAVGKPASETVSLMLDDVAAGGNTGSEAPSLSVDVWGSTDLDGATNDHSFKVAFNGKEVAAKTFDGLRAQRVSTDLALVKEGNNTVQVSLPLDTGYAFDAINLNSIEVKYPRQFVAIDNRLDFKSAFAKFRLSGFAQSSMPSGTADLVVMRVDTNEVTSVVANAKASCRGETCKVQLGGTGQVAHYYVSAEGALHTPELVALPMVADITSGQAKYLIISHPDFIGSDGGNQLEALAAEMTSEMGSADVVDVESIYAQFGHHLFDPTAIRDYIKFAHANRGTRYVLLVGGDVYDYHQFENEDATSFIPSLYAATGNNITFAPVDAKYADINDDNVPDFAIARLPVRTTNQLTNLLGKRAAYMNRNYRGTALLVADNYDAAQQYDFGDDADEVGADYLNGFQVEKAYVDDLGTSAARAKVKQEIDAGTTLTAFFGHSSTNQWSFNGLFTGPDAANLNNAGRPTVVTQWGCWNTYFVSPNEDSMGHRFMMEGDRGAVAVMGASTLTNADSERRLAKLVFARLANGERLGDAVTNAKQEYATVNPNDLDVLLGWTVLGLPELIVD